MRALAIAAAAALAVVGSAAAQSPGVGTFGSNAASRDDLARFDARAAADLPRKLAICDAARFLRSDPDLDADKMFVRRDQQGRFDLLLPPYFVDGFEWYDEDIEDAYRRLKRNGQVDYETVRAARREIGRDMVRTIDRPGPTERAFLRDQSRYCEEVEDFGRS